MFFISYSSVDFDFAEGLKAKLEQSGYKVWMDTDRLQAGVDWRQGIDDAIRGTSGVIVIVSPDSMQSAYVTYEWAFAYGHDKIIIPILYRDTNIHPRLESLQYLDFTHRTNRPWAALLDRLQKI